MKFETIRSDVYRAFRQIRGYIRILNARDNKSILEEYAPAFYDKLAKVFKTTPLVIMQSLSSVGLFDLTVNSNKDKEKLLYEAMWRLCANKDTLKKGVAVLPYRQVSYQEDVLCKILEVESEGIQCYKIKARVLTGHFAPNIIRFNMTHSGLQLLISRVGYDERNYPAPAMMTCLLNTYVKLHIAPPEGSGNRVVDAIVDDGTIRTYNRKHILKYRCGNEVCPRQPSWQCNSCPCSTACPASYTEVDEYFIDV